jgi:hypothetical protein
MNDEPDTETQNRYVYIPPGGVRNHNPRKRDALDRGVTGIGPQGKWIPKNMEREAEWVPEPVKTL